MILKFWAWAVDKDTTHWDRIERDQDVWYKKP